MGSKIGLDGVTWYRMIEKGRPHEWNLIYLGIRFPGGNYILRFLFPYLGEGILKCSCFLKITVIIRQ